MRTQPALPTEAIHRGKMRPNAWKERKRKNGTGSTVAPEAGTAAKSFLHEKAERKEMFVENRPAELPSASLHGHAASQAYVLTDCSKGCACSTAGNAGWT